VWVEKLYWVFQGEDVNLLAHVQLIQHRGQSGRLSATCRAGYENDPILLLDYFLENWRQPKLLKRGDFRLELAHYDGLLAILLENVDPKPRQLGKNITAIAGTVSCELSF